MAEVGAPGGRVRRVESGASRAGGVHPAPDSLSRRPRLMDVVRGALRERHYSRCRSHGWRVTVWRVLRCAGVGCGVWRLSEAADDCERDDERHR